MIARYKKLFHDGDTRDLGSMGAWFAEARLFLQNVKVSKEVSDLIELAYLAGRGERQLMTLCKGYSRAANIRSARGYIDEQREAAAMAMKLKAEGARDFIQQVADKYGVSTKQVGRWVKTHCGE